MTHTHRKENQNPKSGKGNCKLSKTTPENAKHGDDDAEGTKMPGRNTRTPVAGKKQTTPQKN